MAPTWNHRTSLHSYRATHTHGRTNESVQLVVRVHRIMLTRLASRRAPATDRQTDRRTDRQRQMDGWMCRGVCVQVSTAYQSFEMVELPCTHKSMDGQDTHTQHTNEIPAPCARLLVSNLHTDRRHTAVSGPPALCADSQDAPKHPHTVPPPQHTHTRLHPSLPPPVHLSLPPSPPLSLSASVRVSSKTGRAVISCPSVLCVLLFAAVPPTGGEGGGGGVSGRQRCRGSCSRRPLPMS